MKRSHQTLLMVALAVSLSIIPTVAAAASENADEPPALDILVRQIMGGAYEYTSLNCFEAGIKIGDSLKDVERKWGKPDEKSTVMAHYYDHHVSFYYDNSTRRQTIIGIHDYGPQFKHVRLHELKQTIKEVVKKDPINEREVEGNYEVTYDANPTHNIIFIFESNWPPGTKNPKLLSYIIEPK